MTPEEIEQQARGYLRDRNIIPEDGEDLEIGFTDGSSERLTQLLTEFALHYHNQEQTSTPKEGEYWKIIGKYRKPESETLLIIDVSGNVVEGINSEGETYSLSLSWFAGQATQPEITQYWKNRIVAALPSDEDMEKWSTDSEKLWIVDEQIIAEQGAKWVRDKIKDL